MKKKQKRVDAWFCDIQKEDGKKKWIKIVSNQGELRIKVPDKLKK